MMPRRTRVTVAVAGTVAGILGGAPGVAGAQAINWTDWTSASPVVANQATVNGTIMVGGAPVSITYAGEVDFTQTTGGTNYWNPRSTFLGAMLTDASPITSDLIALSGGRGITSTFTFSQPILNPFISFVSVGRGATPVDYLFSAPITIVAGGPSAVFGGGPLAVVPGNPNGVRGLEGNGTVALTGSFTTLTFTTVGGEFWSGITIGVQGLGTTPPPAVIPEPSTVVLMATGLGGLLAAARLRRRREA
jgi:hypothetical protein